MSKSVTVSLAGVEYVVPKLNIGQIEELAVQKGKPFEALRVAMRRASPAIADIDAIEADPDEVAAAIAAILELAGLRKKDAEKNGESPAAMPG